ncbi:tetratricopeptide repeat protein [Pseudomonas fluorescens]|nr:tetratricopeptide repeat protein [Pseudomonas fluorescens]MBD8098000.1 tetratricopeptide repeat protein [Pseudomonas fluorescens]MBD8773589.1 tetratricopeptide repeat protein [Pseudomonas fluorescens]MBD8782209.1 tetratricopeptide repeat protein [Pseudomonas fluorescens]MBD8793896.1 tetratricopeptide repeat protein [Pseudomonas fluorescens]
MHLHGLKALLPWSLLVMMCCADAATVAASDKAVSLFEAQQYQATIEEADRVLQTVPANPEVLNIKALAVSALGDDRTAIRLVTQALEAAQQNGQVSIAQQATYWNNLGYLHERQRNLDIALGYYEKALKMRLAVLGADDLLIADTYNNIGTAQSKLGRYEEAFENLRKNLALRKRIVGDHDASVAVSLNNLGNAYNLQGNHQAALPFFQQALDIDMALHGPRHPTVAIRWNNLGDAYRGLGQYDKAVAFLTKALNSDRATFGENHPKVILRYFNLARVYEAEGATAKAREAYTKALQILRQVDPEDVAQIRYFEEKLRTLEG